MLTIGLVGGCLFGATLAGLWGAILWVGADDLGPR